MRITGDPTSRGLRRIMPLLQAALGAIAFVLLWEAGVRLFGIKAYLLPAPSQIGAELFEARARILGNLGITAASMMLGFLLAVVVALPLAMVIAGSRAFEASVYPIVIFLQILPKIAIAPILIIWFGFGLTPKILLVFLLSFFPIVVAAVAGFKSVNPEILEFSRSAGAGWLDTFLQIRFPSALPEIFTGLKVAAALAVTAAVVAEFVASDRGLGYLLLVYNGELQTPLVFGVVVVLGVVGLALYYLIEVLERLTIPWHASMRRIQQ